MLFWRQSKQGDSHRTWQVPLIYMAHFINLSILLAIIGRRSSIMRRALLAFCGRVRLAYRAFGATDQAFLVHLRYLPG